MASHREPVLPPSLANKLATFGRRTNNEQSDLGNLFFEFSSLPPDLVVRSSSVIAWAVDISRRSLVDRALLYPWSEQDLLARNPDYGWLLLFHWNGYVREQALDAIITPPASPFFFAALAWRLNDWVGAVRRAAVRCAERVLPRIDPRVAATAAPYLLERRLTWGRWRDEADALDSAFGHRGVMADLAIYVQGQSTGPAATCLRHALRYPDIDEHLPGIAAAAVQPSVRAVAYRCLMTGKAIRPVGYEWAWIDKRYGLRKRVPVLASRDIRTGRSGAEWIRDGLRDRSVLVRKVAADALMGVRSQLADESELIAALAADRSPSIRSRADFMLRHRLPEQPS